MEKLRTMEFDQPTATKQPNKRTESIDTQNWAARKQDALTKFGVGGDGEGGVKIKFAPGM